MCLRGVGGDLFGVSDKRGTLLWVREGAMVWNFGSF